MKINLIILSFLLFLCSFAFSQKHEKIYYDKLWKGCQQAKASFYRTYNTNSNGKIIGKVFDYYITGEKQAEIDSAIIIDRNDDQNSKFIGKSTGWYKNGNKYSEGFRDSNGKKNGLFKGYFENGQIKFIMAYKNGILIDKWYLECDEFGKCQKIFFDGFNSLNNTNEWEMANSTIFSSKLIINKGILMSHKTDNASNFIKMYLPFDFNENFSIETIIDFKSGSKITGQGLIYGFKNWDNFYYYLISADGNFLTGSMYDGISSESKWVESSFINLDSNRNLIKINKIGETIYFSINGHIVYNKAFSDFMGNYIGFFVPAGKKEVLFERLLVKQDVSEKIDENITVGTTDEWKGNGSGFFIDTRGYIATNYHVVENVKEIEVEFIQNGQLKSYRAKIISTDKQNDLSIIKIDDPDYLALSFIPYNFKTQISDVGSEVFTLGFPMALSGMGKEVKFTDGKISSKTGYQGEISTYQISVPLQPGNSGGPLFDFNGNFIGIVNAKIMTADNVSYAIKSNYLKNIIDVLPESVVIPNDTSLRLKSLTEKINVLSNYVVLIKIK